MYDDVPKIGDKITGPPPSVFELIISDHVEFVDPAAYGLNLVGINPVDYFVTSGDAVEKAKVLEKDLWRLAGSLRKEVYRLIANEHGCDHIHAQELFRQGVRPTHPSGLAAYEAAIWKAAGRCRRLLNALKMAKGDNCFLETEWVDHRLFCIPKNPRR